MITLPCDYRAESAIKNSSIVLINTIVIIFYVFNIEYTSFVHCIVFYRLFMSCSTSLFYLFSFFSTCLYINIYKKLEASREKRYT
jgi:hypothetical protein